MSVAAIPTVYNGIQFRSRLEARWAAFFDLCSWVWDYEPLDGAGYIPDFRIGRTYFEVKPIDAYDRTAADKMVRGLKGRVSWHPADRSPFVLLKDTPSRIDDLDFCRHVGWFIDPTTEGEYQPCVVWPSCPDGKRPRFGFSEFRNAQLDPEPIACLFNQGWIIDERWAQACNETQWRKPA